MSELSKRCKKCHGTSIALEWFTAHDKILTMQAQPERMMLTCRTCTYEWSEKPLDAK
jgi:hypothetical protein